MYVCDAKHNQSNLINFIHDKSAPLWVALPKGMLTFLNWLCFATLRGCARIHLNCKIK